MLQAGGGGAERVEAEAGGQQEGSARRRRTAQRLEGVAEVGNGQVSLRKLPRQRQLK